MKLDENKELPFAYDAVYDFAGGYAPVRVGQSDELGRCVYGFIDKRGVEVVTPKYIFFDAFVEGRMRVCALVNGQFLYGFLDESLREIIPPQFEVAESFSGGIAAVMANGSWSYIDKSGDKVAGPLTGIAPSGCVASADCEQSNVAIANENATVDRIPASNAKMKWGYINSSGEWSIPAKFYQVKPFSNGVAATRKGRGVMVTFIDADGKDVCKVRAIQLADPQSYNGWMWAYYAGSDNSLAAQPHDYPCTVDEWLRANCHLLGNVLPPIAPPCR
jgi:hypothetical protein